MYPASLVLVVEWWY
jgi:hypothetical protein